MKTVDQQLRGRGRTMKHTCNNCDNTPDCYGHITCTDWRPIPLSENIPLIVLGAAAFIFVLGILPLIIIAAKGVAP